VDPGDPSEWRYDQGEIAGERLHGRGAADAKGPLSAMVAAFEGLVSSGMPLSGKLILMAVGREEEDGLGTYEEIRAGTRAEAAIVGEPTQLSICRAHKGVLRYDIRTSGRAAHASRPDEGINAIAKTGRVILTMDRLARRVSRIRNPLLGRASMAMTLIAGGVADNVIPPQCRLTLDRRFLPEERTEDIQGQIESALQELRKEDEEIQLELLESHRANAAITPEEAEIVQTALKCRRDVLNDDAGASG
ncbi:unnamed protein product, partial [marine sediment metagenome]